MKEYAWPKGPSRWIENRILFVSIPFTWNLPGLAAEFRHTDLEYDRIIVGGPACFLMPNFFADMDHVEVGWAMPGVLQRINPLATRTTQGCTNKCGFCGVSVIEPVWRELADWPDRPVLCDNNLTAATVAHFDKVMDRLERIGWCDFNQGLDCRKLTAHHAERIGRVKKAIARLALDSIDDLVEWNIAACLLHRYGTAKSRIRSYVLCGFNDDPEDAWRRCSLVKQWGALPCPQWFHELDALAPNMITANQMDAGWTKANRQKLMRHFYLHTDGNGSHG